MFLRLSQAEHDGGLGDEFRAGFFRSAQDVDGLLEGRAAVADERRQLGGGLDVVCVDVEAGAGDDGDLLEIAQVVACESFDESRRGFLLDLHDCLGAVAGATVDQVIAVDHCQHNVAESPTCEGFGRVLWLVRVEGWWCSAGLYGAESATSCASVSHQHDRRRRLALVAAAPTVGNVGTFCFLADSVQTQSTQIVLDLLVVVVYRDWRLQPFWQAGV